MHFKTDVGFSVLWILILKIWARIQYAIQKIEEKKCRSGSLYIINYFLFCYKCLAYSIFIIKWKYRM